jgi:hypothetical protein
MGRIFRQLTSSIEEGRLLSKRIGEYCGMSEWTFITNHAHVILAIAEDPTQTVTEIAERALITERSAFRILADLHQAGYIRRSKNGRRNRYELNCEMVLEDPVLDGRSLRDLISLVHLPAEQMSDALLERVRPPPRSPQRRSGRD